MIDLDSEMLHALSHSRRTYGHVSIDWHILNAPAIWDTITQALKVYATFQTPTRHGLIGRAVDGTNMLRVTHKPVFHAPCHDLLQLGCRNRTCGGHCPHLSQQYAAVDVQF